MKKFINSVRILNSFIILLFLATNVLWAQEKHLVKGVIKDNLGEPLMGATVLIKGTDVYTNSNFSGEYEISAASGDVLVFSFIGMISKEITVSNVFKIDVSLELETVVLDDIVVVAYGTQSRRKITSSVTKVNADKVEEVPVASLSTALQGKMSGVRIWQNGGGQPGSSSAITIRGGSSINKSNAPLVLVDGIEMSIDNVNPTDIEGISVLKDATSTAIYGSRASNGVILVTTKKGKIGKFKIDFSSSIGFVQPGKKMDMVDGATYLTIYREIVARSPFAKQLTQAKPWGTGNSGFSSFSPRFLQAGEAVPAGYLSMPDPLDPSKTIIYEDNNFQDIVLQNALEQYYNIQALGGTEIVKYMASFGYTDAEGTCLGTGYNKFNFRTNVDFNIRKNLVIKTRVDHSTSKSKSVNQRNFFSRSIWMAPTTRIYLDDGTLAPGQNNTFTNPYWYLDVNKADRNYYNTAFSAGLEWKIIRDLKFEVTSNYKITNSSVEEFDKANVYSKKRAASFEVVRNNQIQGEAVLDYNKNFKNGHNLDVMAGISAITWKYFLAEAKGEGASSDLIYTLNASSTPTGVNSIKESEALFGAFLRVNYDYKGKYLFNASIRRDASSKFAEGNRAGYFPGVSLGWNIGEENFMKKQSFVSLLKLRASYGTTGNNDVGRYDYAGLYSVKNSYYGQSAFLPASMPNLDLTWETSNQFDIGFELSLFKDSRINLVFDYYNKITRNLIFNVPLPGESGYNNVDKNVGKVMFQGIDFELGAVIFDRESFKWGVNLNFSYNIDKVLQLPDNGVEKNRIGGIIRPDGTAVGGIAEGERMGAITGFKAEGIIDSWAEAESALYDEMATGYSPVDGKKVRGRKIPGDTKWANIYNDDIINVYDQEVLGYITPTFVGGFGTNFEFKGFSLDIFMDYALGASIDDQQVTRSWSALMEGGMNLLNEHVNNAWKQEGDYTSGKAKYPRIDIDDNKQQRNIRAGIIEKGETVASSSYGVMSADYLCLRECRLSYDLPKKLAEKIKFKSLKISLSGQNLHYFTGYKGWNVEYNSSNGNYKGNGYPIPRKIVIGLKFGF